jgi:hypothetical protein
MRIHAHRSLSILACTLVVLFFALSFNAYACIIPVNGIPAATMENGCSTPDQLPVNQYCDTFKTIGVQSVDRLDVNGDYQTICSEDSASLALLVIHPSSGSRVPDDPVAGPPQDILLRISVLRI